jgi:dTDP-D-glucose 4,6-dehydratase
MTERIPEVPHKYGKKDGTLITFVKNRLVHYLRYGIDPRKISRELDLFPAESLDTLTAKMLPCYLDNLEWQRLSMNCSYRNGSRNITNDRSTAGIWCSSVIKNHVVFFFVESEINC